VACNANLQPFDVSGVAAAPIMHTNADELDNNDIDDDDDIKAVRDIPQQPPHAPLVVNDTNDANDAMGSGDDDSLNKDNDNDEPTAATNALEGNKSDIDQGA
jgi:hypothetical protein